MTRTRSRTGPETVLLNLSQFRERHPELDGNDLRVLVQYEGIKTWSDGRTKIRFLDDEAVARLEEIVPRFLRGRDLYSRPRIHPSFLERPDTRGQ